MALPKWLILPGPRALGYSFCLSFVFPVVLAIAAGAYASFIFHYPQILSSGPRSNALPIWRHPDMPFLNSLLECGFPLVLHSASVADCPIDGADDSCQDSLRTGYSKLNDGQYKATASRYYSETVVKVPEIGSLKSIDVVVLRPRDVPRDKKLPLVVWFHGGGLTLGHAREGYMLTVGHLSFRLVHSLNIALISYHSGVHPEYYAISHQNPKKKTTAPLSHFNEMPDLYRYWGCCVERLALWRGHQWSTASHLGTPGLPPPTTASEHWPTFFRTTLLQHRYVYFDCGVHGALLHCAKSVKPLGLGAGRLQRHGWSASRGNERGGAPGSGDGTSSSGPWLEC